MISVGKGASDRTEFKMSKQKKIPKLSQPQPAKRISVKST
jgi:hypothetical protein